MASVYGIILVRKYASAVMAINIMDMNTLQDEDIRKAFQILACSVAMEIPEKLPGGKGIMPGLNRLIVLLNGNQKLKC